MYYHMPRQEHHAITRRNKPSGAPFADMATMADNLALEREGLGLPVLSCLGEERGRFRESAGDGRRNASFVVAVVASPRVCVSVCLIAFVASRWRLRWASRIASFAGTFYSLSFISSVGMILMDVFSSSCGSTLRLEGGLGEEGPWAISDVA